MSQSVPHVLLVEDDPTLGLLLHDVLRLDGFKATLVRDGREALPTFHAGRFDLALLDVMLPGRDGFELTQDLRTVAPHLPIVLLTARDRVEDRVHGLKCGADDYVIKPFDNEELLLAPALGPEAQPSRAMTVQNCSPSAGCSYDPESYELKLGAPAKRRLTPKEGDVLKILLQRAGRTTERDLICQHGLGRVGLLRGAQHGRVHHPLAQNPESRPPSEVAYPSRGWLSFGWSPQRGLKSRAEAPEICQEFKDI